MPTGVPELVPVTPFHLGPGLVLKAVVPRRVSFTAFAATQVAIDLESAYHLFRSEWPIHRELHSLLLATAVGVLVGVVVIFLGRHVVLPENSSLRAEVLPTPALLGGLIGGLSHPLLDAMMHSDLHPFWPVSNENPLLNLVELRTLHLVCIAAGVVGLIVLALRLRRQKGAR